MKTIKSLIDHVPLFFLEIYYYFKWGEVTSKIVGRECNVVSEEEFYDEEGNVIGYWAFGSFSPYFPYQGQTGVTFKS